MSEAKPRILILANSSGGLASFRSELIRKLMETYEVAAAVPMGNRVDELNALGCRLIEVRMERRGLNPISDYSLFRQFKAIIRREKPALVITYTIKPNIYGCLAARMARVPYAANVTGLGTAFERGGMLKRLVVTLYKVSLRKAKVVFFENAENCGIFTREGIIPEEKTCVLSGAGVNLEKYSPLPYPEGEHPIRFLFMGRVMREKGVEELFEAFRHLRADGCDCVLDMLGNSEENYKDRIAACEAEGWLKYHGFQTDVRPFIRDAHCFVLPSWHEGMANTNLECAASARPIITSDIPGCREAVVDGVSGLLCKPKDADSLYAALKRMAETPSEQRERMGKESRRHMEENFDKRRVVQTTVSRMMR